MQICGIVEGVSTSLHTYFGDVASVLPFLHTLPVDCLGIDCTETTINDILSFSFAGKELALGLLDSRSVVLENVNVLSEQLSQVQELCNPKKVWLTPNTGTEYRGYTTGIQKLTLLKQVRAMFNE